MKLKTTLLGRTWQFDSLREVMSKANEEKSGDRLAGIAAGSQAERVAARIILADTTLQEIRNEPAVPYESDEVTRIIEDDLDEESFNRVAGMTISEFREYLLDERTDTAALRHISRGITPEIAAAVTKLMGNLDLIQTASKIVNTACCNTIIGLPGTFSSRLQPNHPSDDLDGIRASVYEGLSYGCGDAVIGLNPVIDSPESVSSILHLFDEIKNRLQVPTQTCVLAHIITQMKAIRAGAPADLMFQSLSGSQKGNEAFGISKAILDEGYAVIGEYGTSSGPNKMYFETGQGSELSADAHFGNDQLVMEARCYGLARHYRPFLVNTVVGFIGPEYLYDSKQVIRAGLEDHFMGKLLGLPMGVDVCYTNHTKADQNDMDNLAVLLGAAGCNYIMGVPHADDVMLNYQSTSFHDAAAVRSLLHKRPIRAFDEWLERMGFYEDGRITSRFGNPAVLADAADEAGRLIKNRQVDYEIALESRLKRLPGIETTKETNIETNIETKKETRKGKQKGERPCMRTQRIS